MTRSVILRAGERLSTVERRHILATLEALNGNQTKAARALGINRQTLRKKLEGYWAGMRIGEVPKS